MGTLTVVFLEGVVVDESVEGEEEGGAASSSSIVPDCWITPELVNPEILKLVPLEVQENPLSPPGQPMKVSDVPEQPEDISEKKLSSAFLIQTPLTEVKFEIYYKENYF